MQSNDNTWQIGEIAILPWTSNTFKTFGSQIYKHFFRSRFICIRESTATQRGILVKVLAKTAPHRIMIQGGEPFCKDDVDDLFKGCAYSSFRFPTLQQLTEVLAIFRENPNLMSVFDEASMHFDLDSSFWIREPAHKLLHKKKPQFYNANTDDLTFSSDDTAHYRLTMLYFQNGQLFVK